MHWSPDQIVERYEKNKPNLPSISTKYRWINLGYLVNGDKTKLSRKGTFKKPAETKGRFNLGKTIMKRPKEIYKRDFFGHWEADTLVSGKKDNYTLKSKYCFVSLAERKTRLYLVNCIQDRKE